MVTVATTRYIYIYIYILPEKREVHKLLDRYKGGSHLSLVVFIFFMLMSTQTLSCIARKSFNFFGADYSSFSFCSRV